MNINKKILVIDDDEMITTLIKRFLTEAGFDALAFKAGTEAHQYLINLKGQVDLIISDIVMPDMEGFEFLALLEKNYPAIPVLMISSDKDYLDMSEHLGAEDIILKPIEQDVLLAKVNELLA